MHVGAGRPRKHKPRKVLNAILYVMKQGCLWKDLPKDFPNYKSVFTQKTRWEREGMIEKIMQRLEPTRHQPLKKTIRLLSELSTPHSSKQDLVKAIQAKVVISELQDIVSMS